MSSAQDEFNQLVNSNRDKTASHPEDRDQSEPEFSDDENDEPSSSRHTRRHAHDSSDEDETTDNMVSSRAASYHVPNTVFQANTGPKGVIADAQAFERARKKSFRRTLLSAAGLDSHGSGGLSSGKSADTSANPPADGSSASDDEEERFMRKWRTSRMQELQNHGMRRASPRGRVYGKIETVDAEEYLDAIEKASPDVVVVVCIYDPEVWPLLFPPPTSSPMHVLLNFPRILKSSAVPLTNHV